MDVRHTLHPLWPLRGPWFKKKKKKSYIRPCCVLLLMHSELAGFGDERTVDNYLACRYTWHFVKYHLHWNGVLTTLGRNQTCQPNKKPDPRRDKQPGANYWDYGIKANLLAAELTIPVLGQRGANVWQQILPVMLSISETNWASLRLKPYFCARWARYSEW